MTELTDEGLIAGEPEVFARNRLVIVTKPGNPEGIEGLADLAAAGTVSLCGSEVPCGRYAQQALDAAGVEIPETSVTRGQSAGATLTAVAEGDAGAGIVYASDAEAAGDAVSTVDIPDDQDVLATYMIGVTAAAGSPDTAEGFMDWVLGDDGQAVLADHGFLPPA
jgi:molybdate transport system substrate-binding protein